MACRKKLRTQKEGPLEPGRNKTKVWGGEVWVDRPGRLGAEWKWSENGGREDKPGQESSGWGQLGPEPERDGAVRGLGTSKGQ